MTRTDAKGASVSSPTGTARHKIPRKAIFGVACASALYAALLLMCDIGTSYGDRIHNPNPPPSAPTQVFLGLRDTTWFLILYGVSAVVVGSILWWLARRWQASGRVHPAAGILLAFILLSFVDPLISWGTFTAYNPDVIHFPYDWAWWNIAPLGQTSWVTGAYGMFFMVPTFAGIWLWHKVAARTTPDSLMHRHPLASTFILGTVVGFLYDIANESLLINMNLWHYSQWWGPSVTIGHATVPMTESLWIGILIGTAMTVLQRDDLGRSEAATAVGRRLPVVGKMFGEIGIIIIIMMSVYCGYVASFTVIRVFDLARSVESTWPFPSSKVYDPYGAAQEAGIPGPYYPGVGAWRVP